MNVSTSKLGRVKKKVFINFLDSTKPNYYDVTLDIELKVSRAHAKMLKANGIITDKEYKEVCHHIKKLQKDIYDGKIHCPGTYHELFFNVHEELFSPLLDIAPKLQIGRSFKDQNVLALKLLIRDDLLEVKQLLLNMNQALIDVSKKYFNVIYPGYNHLQQSVPNLLSNFFMAFYYMFEKDYNRLIAVQDECAVMPISMDIGLEHIFSLDRTTLLKELDMKRISKNNIEAISDRDFAISFHVAMANIMTHLTRLCEDLIIWSSAEFGYLDIPDGFTLGGDNITVNSTPDVLEMIRGKGGKVIGNLNASFMMYRTLPMGQQSDYEDERDVLFDSSFIVKKCLTIMNHFIREVTFNSKKALEDVANNHGLSFITMEYLLNKGVTPAEANNIINQIVNYCRQKKVGLESLIFAEYQQFSDYFDADIADLVSVKKIFNSNESTGLGKISKKVMLETIEREEVNLRKELKKNKH